MKAVQVVTLYTVLFSAPALSQAVSGTVTERTSGLPVRGVGVVLLDSDGRVRMGALSDSVGRYRIAAPSTGHYRLTFSRAGLLRFETQDLELRLGTDLVFDATMTTSVTTLASVEVVAEAPVERPSGNPHKYDEFLRRRKFGLGTFLTRKELESRPRHQLQDIFNGVPGIKVRHNGSQWTLQSQRCSGKSIPGLDAGALAGRSVGPDKKMTPMLFIDGSRVFDIYALSDISPAQVEAVEVYQGAAQLPAEAKGDACFAIFIWLKSG